jgi:lipoate-protein ligase A
MAKLRVLISNTFNPWFNLATEDWIFRDMEPDVHVLYLWRNADTVVIGRFQNPWTECNIEVMEQDKILLSRRQSGGGAVFHDLGNTNFTFLNGKKDYSKEANNTIIINALETFNIEAYSSGRNDIIIKHPEDGTERKISGSAFKETKDRAFHHGTMLINADLSKLSNYLSPHKKKLISKGLTSVRSRVANLHELNDQITHESLCSAIIEEFFKYYGETCEIEHLNDDDLKKIPQLMKYYEHLKDWDWCFGETPKFEQVMEEKLSFGCIEVNLNSHKGIITDIKIFSDSLHPEMIQYLMNDLDAVALTSVGIKAALSSTKKDLPMIEIFIDEFAEWFIKQVS